MQIRRSIQIKTDSTFGGYDYKKAMKLPISFNKYEGKSLEEIKNQYGEICAQHVYTMAARHGIDLTARKVSSTTVPTETYVDIRFETHERWDGKSNWNLYLVSTGHTQSNRDRLVAHGEITTEGLALDSDIMPWVFDQELKKLFGDNLL